MRGEKKMKSYSSAAGRAGWLNPLTNNELTCFFRFGQVATTQQVERWV